MKSYLKFLGSTYKSIAGVVTLTLIVIGTMLSLIIIMPMYWGLYGVLLWVALLVLVVIPFIRWLNDPIRMYPDEYDSRRYVKRWWQ